MGLDVSGVSNETTTTPTITFAKRHGLAGIVTYSSLVGGATYVNGTYQNVKLLNGSQTGSWKGATAKVVVSGVGTITSAEIVSSGSGYSNGESLFFDASVIGNGDDTARFNIVTSGISAAIGNVVQFTGAGTTSDTYHRITGIATDNTIGIARTVGDPVITTNQYAFVVGPSIQITSTTSSSGITTFTCSSPHGLFTGNKFRVIDSSNNNKGDYLVKDRVGVNTFTATTPNISVAGGYILKHGLSANNASSDSSGENLGTRSITLYDEENLVVGATITASSTTIKVSSPVGAAATTNRFPLGSYIQIDEEIMRVSTGTLTGTGNNELSVIRGSLATRQVAHDNGSLIKKIKPIPIELRRPSILRASGHTFEYLGYGPGNYSTGLPQVQTITLTEREEFLVQSQERSAGVVVYTGMNNRGDSFVGNRKTSSATGEETTFDNPIPTVTGADPSRLSVIFDEVIVKERLVVEGGNSGTVLSQFDGPVTFNKEAKFSDLVNIKGQLKVSNTEQSTSTTTGALIVSGGVGIAKNLSVGGALGVTGATTLSSTLSVASGITVNSGGINASGQTITASTFVGTLNNLLTLNTSGTGLSGSTSYNNSGAATFTVTSNATSSGTTSGTIVARGTDGNFTAGTITATLSGNVTGNVTGNVVGDVTGNVTGNLTGTATNATNVEVTTSATSSSFKIPFVNTTASITGNYGLLQDSGTTFTYNPSSNTLTAGIFSGTLSNLLTLNTSGTGLSGSTSYNNSGAATFTVTSDATSANTGGTIVSRDGSGNFSAGTITAAALNVTNATTLNSTLDVTGAATLNSTLVVRDRIECVTPNGGTTGGLRIKANATTGISYLQFTNNAATAEFANIAVKSGSVTLSGALNVTGDITAFYTSDQRLKDNITPIPNALDKVLSISGNTFDWNEKSEKEGNDVGVVAQEILEVLPEAVTTRDNGYLAVRYEKLVPLLIEAIKELKAEINELKGVG